LDCAKIEAIEPETGAITSNDIITSNICILIQFKNFNLTNITASNRTSSSFVNLQNGNLHKFP